MDAPVRISDRVRRLRLDANLTLEQLSEASGVSVRAISDIEREVSLSPRRRTLLSLAEGLGLDTHARRWLLQPTAAEIEARPGTTPSVIHDFVGRHEELVRLADLELTGGLAIVTGPPGIGKTTLAIESTRQLASASPVLFTDLSGHGPLPTLPLDVLRSLLQQVDPDGPLPSTLDSALVRWREICAAVEPIVVLDNAGHESQVRTVLVDGIRSIVVTSRRKLAGLTATTRVVLPSLPLEDGVRLLERIIPERQRSESAVRELAQLCNGSPLALRVAGNHVASRPKTTAADFAGRLRSAQRRIRLLVAGDLSVEAAFAASYDDFEPAAAALFRSISIIDGRTFDARLAASCTGDDIERVEDLLDQLVESGFLDATESNRYQLHDLTRLFGRSRLAEEGEVDEVANRLRSWLLHELGQSAAVFVTGRATGPPGLTGQERDLGEEEAAAWIRREVVHWWPAVQAAASAGDHAGVVDVALLLQEGFAHHWVGWGNWSALFALAVQSARSLDNDRLIARLLGALHWASGVEKRTDFDGVVLASEIVARAERVGDGVQRGWGNYHLAWALLRRHEVGAALAALSAAQDAFTTHAGSTFERETLALAAAIRVEAGELELAQELIDAVIAHMEDDPLTARQRNGRMVSLEEVAAIASASRAHDLAVSAANAQLALARQTPSDSVLARALTNRAAVLLAAFRLDEASEDLDRVRAILDSSRSGAQSSPANRVVADLARRIELARDAQKKREATEDFSVHAFAPPPGPRTR